MVPVGGLEPPHIAIPDFESGVSTISPHWHVFALRRYGIIVTLFLNIRKPIKSQFLLILVDIYYMELFLLS